MKRRMLFSCVLILLSLFFAQGAFCRILTDEEASALLQKEKALRQSMANYEKTEPRDAAAKIKPSSWYSRNPAEISPLMNSKWLFSYVFMYPPEDNDPVYFGGTIRQTSDGFVYLSCSDQYDDTGTVFFRELPISPGGGYGYHVRIEGFMLSDNYEFKINPDGTASGYYYFQENDTGDYSRWCILKGTKIYGQSGNSSVNNTGVDVSRCKIMTKSMTIDSNTVPTTNDTVKFTVTAISDCTIPLYYYYSYAPNYGTDDYDANTWIKVIEGSGFTDSNTFSQKFTNPGYYVVVAWISPKMAISNPVNMIGCTVAVK